MALMWIWLFIWLRLFESTAFFIGLLTSTINGVVPFTLIFILVITAFSSIMYILNERRQLGGGEIIVNPELENDMLNAWID